jgi:hypothetical protein
MTRWAPVGCRAVRDAEKLLPTVATYKIGEIEAKCIATTEDLSTMYKACTYKPADCSFESFVAKVEGSDGEGLMHCDLHQEFAQEFSTMDDANGLLQRRAQRIVGNGHQPASPPAGFVPDDSPVNATAGDSLGASLQGK